METKLLDGKEAAKAVRARVKAAIAERVQKGLVRPCLAVIIVGSDPASQTYVANKEKACGWVGMDSRVIRMPEDTEENALLEQIDALNNDPSVHGILVQLPLPKHICEQRVLYAIRPEKDADGFHPVNVGKLQIGDESAFVSCTPAGIIELLRQNEIRLDGLHAVVVGRSNIVGKPMAQLLLKENATVTVCHSHTKGLSAITRQADLLVCAVGRPHYFSGDDISEGCVVVDVGIHRTEEGLIGDMDTESCLGRASAITPVPGGVGPMTIAMLLVNCLKACELQEEG